MKMKASIVKGLSFGLASGIVTTLGLMVGLYTGTNSKLAVLGGILTIAIADAMSDAFGILLSEKSQKEKDHEYIWQASFATFFAKLIFALTFAVPVLFLELGTAILVSIGWGIFLLGIVSILIAEWRKESVWKTVLEHWGIAVAVITLAYLAGLGIEKYFGATCA